MTVHSIEKALRTPDPLTIPFIRDFAPDVGSALLENARTELFQKGDRIFAAGDIPARLGIILSGMVELCGTTRDPTCGVLMLARGDVIFPMAVLHQEPCLTSVSTLIRSRVLMLDGKVVSNLATSRSEVAAALARIMGAHWRMAVRHIIDLKSRSAAERLAAFLLKFVDHSDEDVVRLPFTKATLASRLGISRETLSRIIQVVADHGIFIRGSQIEVRDRAAADAFCGPDPYVRRSERSLDVHAF